MSITLFIILLTALTSILAFNNSSIFNQLKFNAFMIYERKQWYRLFSYSLLHADWGHLFVNMFVLYSFGSLVEDIFPVFFGNKAKLIFIILYAGGVSVSTLYSLFKHKHNHYYNAVGASGAVSAVLFSSIIMHPEGEIFLFFIPVPIPAYIFGLLYLVYSAYMAKRAKDNIGHDAHFWGAVFGIVYTIAIRPEFANEFLKAVIGIQI